MCNCRVFKAIVVEHRYYPVDGPGRGLHNKMKVELRTIPALATGTSLGDKLPRVPLRVNIPEFLKRKY